MFLETYFQNWSHGTVQPPPCRLVVGGTVGFILTDVLQYIYSFIGKSILYSSEREEEETRVISYTDLLEVGGEGRRRLAPAQI